MASNEKKYGLLDPKKKLSAADVFNNDSDSADERGGKDWIKKKLQKDAEKGVKKQTVIDMNRALEQDPTVYQYDEVYETIKKKETEVNKPKAERKVKYMDALLKTADRRKKETERRTERLVQKEREAEGEMFKDKEEFITSSYRQKLEEMKKAEEEENKMEYIESVMDVTKQQDMGSFYRQLYQETVPEGGTNELKSENPKPAVKKGETEQESKQEKHHHKEAKKLESSSSGSSGSDSSSDSSSSSSDSSSAEDDVKKNKETAKETPLPIKPVEANVAKAPVSTAKTPLEDGEIGSAAEEDKQVVIKTTEATPAPSENNTTKFGASSRRDRSYRQRESSVKETEVEKEPEKDHVAPSSAHRREDRPQPHREDRSGRGDRERGRDRERDRDRARRDERRGGPAWRPDERARDTRGDSRRNRSRSRTRREQEEARSPRKPHEKKESRRPRDRPPSDDQDRREKDKVAKSRHDDKEKKLEKDIKEVSVDEDKSSRDKQESKSKSSKPTSNPSIENAEGNNKENVEELPKENIWKKRTVGALFDGALERYYKRKAAKAS